MAERNEKVMDRVRQELGKNAKLGSRQLYEIAQTMDPAIAQDTVQQFHARYVLPVKREKHGRRTGGRAAKGRTRRARTTKAAAGPARRRAGGQGNAETDRDRIRAVLLQFARDFAAAESRSDVVQVLSRVDDYVERITEATS